MIKELFIISNANAIGNSYFKGINKKRNRSEWTRDVDQAMTFNDYKEIVAYLENLNEGRYQINKIFKVTK